MTAGLRLHGGGVRRGERPPLGRQSPLARPGEGATGAAGRRSERPAGRRSDLLVRSDRATPVGRASAARTSTASVVSRCTSSRGDAAAGGRRSPVIRDPLVTAGSPVADRLPGRTRGLARGRRRPALHSRPWLPRGRPCTEPESNNGACVNFGPRVGARAWPARGSGRRGWPGASAPGYGNPA